MSTRHAPGAALLEPFGRLGEHHYGEVVTQTQHALQCAALACSDGADDALVAAALLHDLGHLLAPPRPEAWRDDVDDDHHEAIGARAIRSVLGRDVAAPVALHVVAKRWRAATDAAYLDRLSAASTATLLAQGGPLDEAAVARFEAHAAFCDAVRLRDFDEAAKDPSGVPGSLRDYEALLDELAKRHASDPDR